MMKVKEVKDDDNKEGNRRRIRRRKKKKPKIGLFSHFIQTSMPQNMITAPLEITPKRTIQC